MLRELDLAARQEIPLYLNTDPDFAFNGLPSTHLAEVLGALLNNAIEAAAKAHAPRVNVTLASTPDFDEIILSQHLCGKFGSLLPLRRCHQFQTKASRDRIDFCAQSAAALSRHLLQSICSGEIFRNQSVRL